MANEVRVSRADVDVARQMDAPTVRVSRADVDVARLQDVFELRVTTLKMTVVRLPRPTGTRIFPLTTRTASTNGTRTFPIPV